jgi:hypothetical protein
VSAALLTLVVLPVMYDLLEATVDRLGLRLRARR